MNIKNIIKNLKNEINSKNVNINEIKSKYIGRKGIINKIFNEIKYMDSEKKRKFGLLLNKIKNKVIDIINYKTKNNIKKSSKIDISLPGYGSKIAKKHIINKTINDIEKYFISNGFKLITGKEIDDIYFNFDALNMPVNHPSRSINETFYIDNKNVLRTHTSNMQIHVMKNKKPPMKIISCGKVYRKDYDSSHTPMFHQIEGFIIDKNISIANLKYLLFNFLKFFFYKNIKINFRSSYFPFTEPSMEIDIECINCYGKKCSLCKYTGWIEVLGCGIIHNNVLQNCSINKEIYTGFAFGMGIERLTMIKYKINDIRLYFENNIDFLEQF